jgi:hypothetical protein
MLMKRFTDSGLKTPHLLELSGIGNRTILEKAGIPVKLDLPAVGENIQEHYYIKLSWGECSWRRKFFTDTAYRAQGRCIPRDVRHPGRSRDGQEASRTLVGAFPPNRRDCSRPSSKHKKGLFAAGITGFGFVPLSLLSPRAEELRKEITERVHANADKYPPGLKEQYDIMLDRLARGAPAIEIMPSPGCHASPSSFFYIWQRAGYRC